MSRHSGTAVRATRKPVIVLAGEDATDRACLKVVLESICPEARGRIVEITCPVRLRDASPETLKGRIARLVGLARARALREDTDLAGMFVHEDLDALDGDRYLATHGRIQQALAAALGPAYYVLAVEEIEAWLLLFPDALAATASTWIVPTGLQNRDTGRIADPKGVLVRKVCTGSRRYRESDAPTVLRHAAQLGLLTRPVGANRSWRQFHDDIVEFCQSPLRATRASGRRSSPG